MTVYLSAAAPRAACWLNYELPHAACVEYANAFRRLWRMRQLLLTVLACGALAPALAQQPPVSSIRVTGDARVTAELLGAMRTELGDDLMSVEKLLDQSRSGTWPGATGARPAIRERSGTPSA